MTTNDFVYAWGTYGPPNQWNSPQLIKNFGTGGLPSPLGAVQSIDAENAWWFVIIGGIPYGIGDNPFNNIDQTATSPFTAPQGIGASSDGGASWFSTGAGVTLPILQCDGGDFGSWAVDSAGAVWAWGHNPNGQLGQNNTTSPIAVPSRVLGVGAVGNLALKIAYGAVTAGAGQCYGLLSGGGVVSCGNDVNGEAGDGQTLPGSNNLTPVNVVQGAGPGSGGLLNLLVAGHSGTPIISAGNHHVVVLDSQGNVWSWGYNAFGQLGNNSLTSSSSPVAPSWPGGGAAPTFPIVWVNGGGGQITTDGQSLAIDSAGHLWGWGANGSGQLTSVAANPQKVPIDITSALTGAGATLPILKAYSGKDHALVLDSAGVLWVFGNNNAGQLGIPSLGSGTSTPTAINAGALATLPTAGVINFAWAGNQTSMVDISLTSDTTPVGSGGRGNQPGMMVT